MSTKAKQFETVSANQTSKSTTKPVSIVAVVPPQVPEPTKAKSKGHPLVALIRTILRKIANVLKEPDLTYEQWESLERKYSPHSSHHAQTYYRDRS